MDRVPDLARALRQREVACRLQTRVGSLDDIRLPAIVGVRMRPAATGHFIAMMGITNGGWDVADPLTGRQILSDSRFSSTYEFTGFAMELQNARKPFSDRQ